MDARSLAPYDSAFTNVNPGSGDLVNLTNNAQIVQPSSRSPKGHLNAPIIANIGSYMLSSARIQASEINYRYWLTSAPASALRSPRCIHLQVSVVVAPLLHLLVSGVVGSEHERESSL